MLLSQKARFSFRSLLGVVDQMPFCWEISRFLKLLLFIMKYRIGMFGLGEGDFEPYKRMHKFLKGNLTFVNQQAPLNNIFININKNILPNIQQMQIAPSFLKIYTGSIKMMLKVKLVLNVRTFKIPYKERILDYQLWIHTPSIIWEKILINFKV